MKKARQTIRVSSKGQIVIPAAVRRKLGLVAGGELRVRLESPRTLVLTVPEYDDATLERIFRRAREWTERTQRDLVEELHERRRQERAKKGKMNVLRRR